MRTIPPMEGHRAVRAWLAGYSDCFTKEITRTRTLSQLLTREIIGIHQGLDFFTSEIVQTLAPKGRERHSAKSTFLPLGTFIRKYSFFFLAVGTSIRFKLTIWISIM
jgi:hypothetical protein